MHFFSRSPMSFSATSARNQLNINKIIRFNLPNLRDSLPVKIPVKLGRLQHAVLQPFKKVPDSTPSVIRIATPP